MNADVKIIEVPGGREFPLQPVIDYDEYNVKWIDPQANIINPCNVTALKCAYRIKKN
jgi:hypothetical protein